MAEIYGNFSASVEEVIKCVLKAHSVQNAYENDDWCRYWSVGGTIVSYSSDSGAKGIVLNLATKEFKLWGSRGFQCHLASYDRKKRDILLDDMDYGGCYLGIQIIEVISSIGYEDNPFERVPLEWEEIIKRVETRTLMEKGYTLEEQLEAKALGVKLPRFVPEKKGGIPDFVSEPLNNCMPEKIRVYMKNYIRGMEVNTIREYSFISDMAEKGVKIKDFKPYLIEIWDQDEEIFDGSDHKLWSELSKVEKDWDSHTVYAWVKTMKLFGLDQGKKWIGPNPEDTHDRGISLPKSLPKEWKDFLWRQRDLRWRDAIRVVNQHDVLDEKGFTPKLGLTRLLSIINSLRYENVTSEDFSIEAGRWALPVADYQEAESRWLKAINSLQTESIPQVIVEDDEGHRFYRLNKDDPRGLFVGCHVFCCQHPKGVGSTSAWRSIEDPDSAVYVVEKNGAILAESWAWRSPSDMGIMVFDNVEALQKGYPWLRPLYEKAAKALLGRLGIKQVNVGTDNSDMDLSGLKPADPSSGQFSEVPTFDYSDARHYQLILAGEA